MDRIAARILLLEGWRRAALAFLAGAVATLALPPVNFPAAGFVSFPILVWLLDGAAGRPGAGPLRRLMPAFRIGWMFGFGYFIAGLWWLGAAMLVDAADFLWAIPFAVLILPAILAIYYGLAAALARSVWSENAGRLFSLAAAFAFFEWARGVLFTGFPWNEIGMMAAPVPLLMQSVSVIGLHGLTLAAIYVYASPAVIIGRQGRAPALLLAMALVVAHVGYGVIRLSTAETGSVDGVTLRIVQPNIEQTLKWDEAEEERIFARLLSLSARPAAADAADGSPPAARTGNEAAAVAPGDDDDAMADTTEAEGAAAARRLIIWPETAFPFLLTQRPDAITRIADMLQPGETLIAGGVRLEARDDGARPLAYNAVYVIDERGEIIDARDKTHLVPFGEYLPLQAILQRFGISQIVKMPGGFSPGAVRSPVPLDDAPSFLPLICYEIIFPGEMALPAAGERPGFIVNVTNDAWYGRTPGPYQHLRQAELTAAAFGLPLVRSANTGISVVTDGYGRVMDGMALGSGGAFETALPHALPATFYAHFGDRIFWVAEAVAAVLAAASLLRWRHRRD
ncbi:apolipoprotein N-acyltransferase [Mangrovicella endophytica]|uniref:apolipoprotein N-acyltransferase n=1 Tax=Mangrovicella endophytica TaxID=2066697 RepID=UPI001FDF4F3A|nr:apolipoprotein N-acyltransferase [Mangrovicella endophytica]